MIGAFNPIIVAPAPRAIVNRAAARPVAVSGKPMLFIPVGMPDGVISVAEGVTDNVHCAGLQREGARNHA